MIEFKDREGNNESMVSFHKSLYLYEESRLLTLTVIETSQKHFFKIYNYLFTFHILYKSFFCTLHIPVVGYYVYKAFLNCKCL